MDSVDDFLKKIKPFKMGPDMFRDLVDTELLSGMVTPIGSFFLSLDGSWGYGRTVCGNSEVPGILPERCVTGKELWRIACKTLMRGRSLLCQNKSGEIFKVTDSVMKPIYVFFTGNAKHPSRDKIRMFPDNYLGRWPYWFDEVKGERMPKKKSYFSEYIKGRSIIPVTKDYYEGRPVAYELATLREGKIFSLGFLTRKECQFPDSFLKNPEKYAMLPCKMKAMEIIPGLHKVQFLKFVSIIDKELSEVCNFDELFNY